MQKLRNKSFTDISQDSERHTIYIPMYFNFGAEIVDFEEFLSPFNWNLKNSNVIIDFSLCKIASYQALAALYLYIWHLKSNNCHIRLFFKNRYGPDRQPQGIYKMWLMIDGKRWETVLDDPTSQFRSFRVKPTLAIRGSSELKEAMKTFSLYAENFNIDYKHLLEHLVSELIYNTIDHGHSWSGNGKNRIQIPSIIQTAWQSKRNEISFIIADNGIGIRKHLSKYLPGLESDQEAILKALEPKVSGAFGQTGYASGRENAGYGLYVSSNIIRKLNADMYVISGNGLVHISPRDITSKTMPHSWPGTIAFARVKINKDYQLSHEKVMQDIRTRAQKEINDREGIEKSKEFYLSVENVFGTHAEDKYSAKGYRESKLVPAVSDGKNLIIDFENVVHAPHSFINALLKEVVIQTGLLFFKRVRFINTPTGIRETIDQVFNENT